MVDIGRQNYGKTDKSGQKISPGLHPAQNSGAGVYLANREIFRQVCPRPGRALHLRLNQSMKATSGQTAVAAGIIFSILWPSASTATKIALSKSQPFNICLVRFTCAGLIMILLSHLILKLRLPKGREWRSIALYGLLANTLYLGLYVVAMQQVSAGLGALSVAIAPIFINLGGAILDK